MNCFDVFTVMGPFTRSFYFNEKINSELVLIKRDIDDDGGGGDGDEAGGRTRLLADGPGYWRKNMLET